LGSSLLSNIKSTRTHAAFAYSNNGCFFFTKDDLQGGKYVLVQNRNTGAGIGSTPLTVNSGYPSGNTDDRWRIICYTNAWVNRGITNYLYFWMTNSILDFNALGCGQKCVVTTADYGNYGNCSIDAETNLPITVFAGGSRLYHIQPVQNFSENAGIKSLIGMPYFDFYSEKENPKWLPVCEPYSPPDNYMENGFIKKRELAFCGTTSYPLNGAKNFVAVMGVDNSNNGQDGIADFYVDGNLILTVGPYTAAQQHTNIVLTFSPTNKVLTISSRNTQVCFQTPVFICDKSQALSFVINNNSISNRLTAVTLQWNCTNILPEDLTGIVSATNPRGPWRVECQFPAEATNFWMDTNSSAAAKFYRAFTGLGTNTP
jgi:hypothetical protein